ncbi:hypothetical protein SDC9_201515 [bioreactor metagenome]|uniref:Uncharacterized protein n=1 Tax=bioreactor metagenome TaxID=1076179 RepID=A0A645IRJ3_9ZZZZ
MNRANQETHERGLARNQRDQGGEKGDARRKPNPNKRKPQKIQLGFNIGERVLFASIAIGGTIALLYIVANDITGIGSADDMLAAPIVKVIWDNGSKVFA